MFSMTCILSYGSADQPDKINGHLGIQTFHIREDNKVDCEDSDVNQPHASLAFQIGRAHV